MKFFLDTADIDEIKKLDETGMVDGVTTNPSIIAKSGQDFLKAIAEIAEIMGDRSVSAECISLDYDSMLAEAKKLSSIAKNITIKVPLTVDGLRVCKALTDAGTTVNVTLCFAPHQALLAAKAGATYISPFVGRHDDWGRDGMSLIEEIATIYDNYNFDTQILVASTRHQQHILDSALIGADVITVPPKLIWQMYKHPYTDLGIDAFVKDWQGTGQKIL